MKHGIPYAEHNRPTKKKKIKPSNTGAKIDSISQQLNHIGHSSTSGSPSVFASSSSVSSFTSSSVSSISPEMQSLALQNKMDSLQFLRLLLLASHQNGGLGSLLPELDRKAKQKFKYGIEHIITNATNTLPLDKAVSILAQWLIANGCW